MLVTRHLFGRIVFVSCGLLVYAFSQQILPSYRYADICKGSLHALIKVTFLDVIGATACFRTFV